MYIRLINQLLAFVFATVISGAVIAQEWKNCCPDNKTIAKLDADGTFTVSGHGSMCKYHEFLNDGENPEDRRPWQNHLRAIVKVIIEDGVTHISNSAFANCRNLTSVAIAGSVDSISMQAFANNPLLAFLTISDGVKVIGNVAFEGCKSLKSVTFPQSLTSISNSAFAGCDSLIAFNVVSGNIGRYYSKGGVLFYLDSDSYIWLLLYPTGKMDSSYIVPQGVRAITGEAFQGCYNLKSITIPSSVTGMGEYIFENPVSIFNLNPKPPFIQKHTFSYAIKTSCVLYIPQGSRPAYSTADNWKDFENIIEIDPSTIIIPDTISLADFPNYKPSVDSDSDVVQVIDSGIVSDSADIATDVVSGADSSNGEAPGIPSWALIVIAAGAVVLLIVIVTVKRSRRKR